jgi:hypothetical protein
MNEDIDITNIKKGLAHGYNKWYRYGTNSYGILRFKRFFARHGRPIGYYEDHAEELTKYHIR